VANLKAEMDTGRTVLRQALMTNGQSPKNISLCYYNIIEMKIDKGAIP
jgi:hypothetical protein